MKLEELQQLSDHFKHADAPPDMAKVQQYLLSVGMDPNNLYQELEMSHRFVQAHADTSYSNTQLQLHSHAFYELLYCCSDCGAEYLVGSERYRLQRGDIVFVAPGISHRPLLPEHMAVPYKRYVIWLSPEFMEVFSHLLQMDPTQPPFYSALIRTADSRFENMHEYFHQSVQEAEVRKPGWEAVIMGNAVILLINLYRALRQQHSSKLTAEKPDLLDQAIAYIEENLSIHISLAEIAQHFYVSQSTISQLFRKKLGVSFYRCVTQRRLIAAKELILSGSALENVARQVGFSDYSSFYRAFRQEYGISPRQYRTLQEVAGKESGKM